MKPYDGHKNMAAPKNCTRPVTSRQPCNTLLANRDGLNVLPEQGTVLIMMMDWVLMRRGLP